MSPVGTRSTASELLIREIPDAVERVPTQGFMVQVDAQSGRKLPMNPSQRRSDRLRTGDATSP